MAEKDATARLRRAVKENNLFLVKRMAQRTDMRNPDPAPRRYTSLAWAAVLGHEETFEFLLTSGHDDEELSKDSENNTILMLLADHKPPATSPYSSHPDADDTTRAALRMARLYYDRYPDVLDWSNMQGKTALHIAALKGNEELVRMLCDLGADYDLSDNKGNTALHYASSWGHIPVVQLLIERGCQYAAKNNQGFTASDYAYSFSTRDTLQDTARLQFENNKKSRRNIFAQAAARGTEWGGAAPINVPPPVPSKTKDYRQASVRMRSGSGTSRTTATTDSGEADANIPPPVQLSQSIMSSTPSPSQPSAASSVFTQQSSSHSVLSSNSTGTFSAPSPTPSHSSMLNPPANPASSLSPIATRMRERDADAMEKYMRRNRSGSSSTDNKSQNESNFSSAGPSANGDDISSLANIPTSGSSTPRRLRPSMSAAQLRTNVDPPSIVTTNAEPQAEVRSRSGTNPTRPLPLLTRSSSQSNSGQTPSNRDAAVFEEPESFVGPPSKYAQFPEPPVQAVDSTPTAASRRLPFNILSKSSTDSINGASHRRGLSATSVRGG